ncbi:dipeptidase [uncultured Imperialibacter sp.]|uniref:dipeptidase n=1 Tax=uncultured Imperialibacter sp. TaxID=1672639 RepID=UPI0030DB4B5D|tara:strand:- start:1746 stop:3005 length:1260 start_codon:yes stop_codon:yes gene_type:complete
MKKLVYCLLIAVLAACSTPKEEKKDVSAMSDDELRAYADTLAHKFILTDGHVDLPYRMKVAGFILKKEIMDVSVRTPEGNFDYVRAKEGGLDAPMMSIYIPSSYGVTQEAKNLADSLIDMVEKLTTTYPDKFALAKTPAAIEENFKAGLISLPMGMENGAPLMEDLANVAYFADRGINYITLTHGKDNQICDSSYDTTYTWNGLSPFGEEVVKEMNKQGIMVDISHVSDSTFYDVMALTDVPAIASHSSCRYFTPGFERNMSDEMIKMLGENGGVIQINFGSSFLSGEVREKSEKVREHMTNWLAENGLSYRDSTAQAYMKQYVADSAINLFATVGVVADHIDHVVEIAGIDHVGLGSDYDGVGDSLPTGLKDVSEFPNLIYELLKRGYTEEDIAKICYQNVFRVWNAVLDKSKELKGA